MTGSQPAPVRDRWRSVPIVGWIRSYERSWLRGDLIAGVAVAALGLEVEEPRLRGDCRVPPQNGLYAAAAGAEPFTRSSGQAGQYLPGPSSGSAPVAASAIAVAGTTGTQDAAFVAVITLASGVLFLLLAVLRMGWIAQFLSAAVVTGFLFGAAIDVVIGELPEADRDQGHRLELAPGAVVLARVARRFQPGDRSGQRGRARRRVRRAGDRTKSPRCPGPGDRRPARVLAL